jgi:geranylgeranyl diphosphate synthase type I
LAALTSNTPAGDRLATLYRKKDKYPVNSEECAEVGRLIEDAGGRAWAKQRVQQAYADARTALELARAEPGACAELLALVDMLAGRDR